MLMSMSGLFEHVGKELQMRSNCRSRTVTRYFIGPLADPRLNQDHQTSQCLRLSCITLYFILTVQHLIIHDVLSPILLNNMKVVTVIVIAERGPIFTARGVPIATL